MSKQLLSTLNGNNTGKLKDFIDNFVGEPRIAWYPSAGMDYRPLVDIHPGAVYNYHHMPVIPEADLIPLPPDIFIFTDYNLFGYPNKYIEGDLVHRKGHMNAYLESIEVLPDLNLPLHNEIVFPENKEGTNSVFLCTIRITLYGESIWVPVIYACVENEAFYGDKLIPENAIISHIIHVRYHINGQASGGWLLNVLDKLKCGHFITDDNHDLFPGDVSAMKMYPSIPEYNVSQFIFYKDVTFINIDTWPIPPDANTIT